VERKNFLAICGFLINEACSHGKVTFFLPLLFFSVYIKRVFQLNEENEKKKIEWSRKVNLEKGYMNFQ
jgi:hypothetical protein